MQRRKNGGDGFSGPVSVSPFTAAVGVGDRSASGVESLVRLQQACGAVIRAWAKGCREVEVAGGMRAAHVTGVSSLRSHSNKERERQRRGGGEEESSDAPSRLMPTPSVAQRDPGHLPAPQTRADHVQNPPA